MEVNLGMSDKKVELTVFIKENSENQCAKCCKAIQVIERMMEAFSNFKNKIDLTYLNTSSQLYQEKYGNLDTPIIIVNEEIFSYGHVPIIKKLGKKIIESLR